MIRKHTYAYTHCMWASLRAVSFYFLLYLVLERGEGKEKDREGNIDVPETLQSVSSRRAPAGDLACNPGMCPHWVLNRWPFGLQAGTQCTEPHQSGLDAFLYSFYNNHGLSPLVYSVYTLTFPYSCTIIIMIFLTAAGNSFCCIFWPSAFFREVALLYLWVLPRISSVFGACFWGGALRH